MNRALILILCLLSLSISLAFGQEATVKGKISNTTSKDLLPFVNVSTILNGNTVGTQTDEQGVYELKLPAGKHELSFSYIGLKKEIREIELTAGETYILDVEMLEEGELLNMVVISGSQYEKRLAEETVSLDVIQDYIIENRNAVDLKEAVETVPGVTIVDGQATIRGGSGYAYGTGSRVQVLVDGLPMLTGDFSEVRWDYIPMETAEQIEVIKGAASVLYGSSALNGVISVETGYARTEPETSLSIYQGFYGAPRNKKIKWWEDGKPPSFSGTFFSHRRKIKHLDLVMGGNLYFNSSYLKEADDRHGRINIKTRYINPRIKGLSYGMNTNLMLQDYGRFVLWQHADTAAYEALSGTISRDKYSLISFDPYVSYIGENGVRHKVKTRYYRIVRHRKNFTSVSSNSKVVYGEYQFQKRFASNFTLTTGAVASVIWGFDRNYNNGKNVSTYNTGAYAQVEQKLNRLSLVGGMRYEYYAIDAFLKDSLGIQPANSPLVGRFGLNYELTANAFLRASIGQGYRSPSILERFVTTELSGIKIVANPTLVPEKGWNAEIGIKKGLSGGWLNGYIDAAVFWTEIDNMTEFAFGSYEEGLGFKIKNVRGARIAGCEVSTVGEGELFNLPFRLMGGYTFNYPADLEVDTTQRNVGIYLGNLFQSIGSIDSVSDGLLKYRFRNVARLDMEIDVKKLTIGYNLTYNGAMENIDAIFSTVIPGLQEYREQNPHGSLVSDFRLTYQANEMTTFAFVAKNFMNNEYMIRPGYMEAPVNFTFQCKMKM